MAPMADRSKHLLETMIAELVPLEETRVGRDLIEIGEGRGMEMKARRVVLRLVARGRSTSEIAGVVEMSEMEVAEFLNKARGGR